MNNNLNKLYKVEYIMVGRLINNAQQKKNKKFVLGVVEAGRVLLL